MESTCDLYRDPEKVIKIKLKDMDGNNILLNLTAETMFQDFSAIKQDDKFKCFIPIFG